MDPLEYATAHQKSKEVSARDLYWIIFACALVPGSFLWVAFIWVFEKIRSGGFHVVRYPFLELMPFLALGIVASGLATLAARPFVKNDRFGWVYALSFALLGPTVTLLLIIDLF